MINYCCIDNNTGKNYMFASCKSPTKNMRYDLMV